MPPFRWVGSLYANIFGGVVVDKVVCGCFMYVFYELFTCKDGKSSSIWMHRLHIEPHTRCDNYERVEFPAKNLAALCQKKGSHSAET